MFVETKFFHKAGEGSGGGGGSDPHNLGYYADLTALQTAHPTGTDGDFAILGSTDTIWVWDSGTSAWKDSDTKGQVTSVNGQTGAVTVGTLPDQTGNADKFLTTDGTDASWSDKPLVNTTTQSASVSIKGNAATSQYCVNVGVATKAGGGSGYATAVGYYARATDTSAIAIGESTNATHSNAIAIGGSAQATATAAIQLGRGANDVPATFKVGLGGYGNYTLLNSDGTIPTDRLPNAINKYSTMPAAASANVGWIVQFTGTTDSTYTHGYIYECKAQGTDPETYAWEAVEVQAGGGSGLPDQTGQSGKFLTTDGTDASWSDKPLVNKATNPGAITILGSAANTMSAINIGLDSNTSGNGIALGAYSGVTTQSGGIALGYYAKVGPNSNFSTALGGGAEAYAENAIQLGWGRNSTAQTFSVALSSSNNYRLLDSDGTIPTDRFTTTPVADGTYVPTLTISSGTATRSWAAPSGGGSTALSLTLAAANWSNNSITVTATGVTASNNVIVSPAPASQSAYTTAGVMCTAQATDSLTFTCTTTPSSDLTVTVLII